MRTVDVHPALARLDGAVPLHLAADSGYVEWKEFAPLLQDFASRWASIALNASSVHFANIRGIELPLLEDPCVVLTPPCIHRCLDFVAHAPRMRKVVICSLVECGTPSVS